LIRHALADILMRGDTGDPELEKLAVSVVEVQMSPDLRIATAYVRGLINSQTLVLAAWSETRSIAGWWRRIDVKYMPEIRFRIDTSLQYAQKIGMSCCQSYKVGATSNTSKNEKTRAADPWLGGV
jgi:ribosome-binding factor A